MMDPILLASITASITQLGTEYIKGLAGEAGKTSWAGIKALFGWSTDPAPEEISAKAKRALDSSPDLIQQLLPLLKASPASPLVGNLDVQSGGKVVIAGQVETLNM